MILIPAIDLRNGQCIRLFQGDFSQPTNYEIKPISLLRKYRNIGFKNVHVVDLDGAMSGKQRNQDTVQKIIQAGGLSVQLGGGIRHTSQIESWLDTGVARIVIGTSAIEEPKRFARWLRRYSPDRIVLALDVKVANDGIPYVATHGWQTTSTRSLRSCISEFLEADLLHLLCTDISRDGAMTGPNLNLYSQILERFPTIRLQASGGVRNFADLTALRSIGIQASISGRAMLENKFSNKELVPFLRGA